MSPRVPPLLPEEEERIIDPVTGGEKGRKLERFELIPVGPLNELARLYGAGAAKYADRNWELGYAWSLSYAAAMRHLTQFWDGESVDPETQRHHLASVIFHAMALMEYEAKKKGTDDRPKNTPMQTVADVIAYLNRPREWISVADSKAEAYADGEATLADVLPPDVDSSFDVAPPDDEPDEAEAEEGRRYEALADRITNGGTHRHDKEDHNGSGLGNHKGCVPCPVQGCPCHHPIQL